MPWKETDVLDLRMELVTLVRREGVTVVAAAEVLGISRKTAYKWLRRFETDGRRGLKNESRAPRSHPNRTDATVCALIIRVRKRHPTWGPVKILQYLSEQGAGALPAASTAGDILKRAELVKSRPRRNPQPKGGTSSASSTAPNDLWTVDFKGDFRLGCGARCYPLTMQDHHSRYMLRVRACAGTLAQMTRQTFRSVFREFGVPRRILSDNGAPFVVRGLTGLTSVAVDWMKQDIQIERTRVGSPQDNGSHERMHRDLKAETTRPPCRTMQGQQHRFTGWTRVRNNERPHEALDGATPSSIYTESVRAYRERPVPWEYQGHWETVKVRQNGMMTWKGAQVYVSEALIGETVGFEEIDDGIWRLCYRRTQLGLLDERRRGGPRVWIPNPWWVTKGRQRARPPR